MLRQFECSVYLRLSSWPGMAMWPWPGNVLENPICKQCVRWKGRKPIWLPIAKSKMFRIPPRPQVPKEESVEISRLTANYNTYIKSVRVFLSEDLQSSVGQEQLVDAGNVEDDLFRSKEINNTWNAEVARIREGRLLREREERLNLVSEKLQEKEEIERQEIIKINELVRKEKEREKYYITPDNIDEVIENALRAEVDHNFAIDVKGNIHREDSLSRNKESFQEKGS